MSKSRRNTILLGHSNIFQKGPWKNDERYTNSFRDDIQADLDKHDDCLKSAFYNILAFLKSAETRGHSECRKKCNEIIKKDHQNINAHLQLYDISNNREERKKILITIKDIINSDSKNHFIGVALIELGVALSILIPMYYEQDENDDELDTFFDQFEILEFQSDVKNLDILWRNKIDDRGLYNHEAKNVHRWYNSVIYLKEGLYRLKNSHLVSSSELEIYRFSLAQASNRLSHVLFSSGGADHQRDHYSEASMKGFCEVVNKLDHTRYGFYVCRSLAYLGLMIQKKKKIEGASVSPPDCFRRLVDLEIIWNNPEKAYEIAGERFKPDIVVCTRYGKFLVNAGRYDEALLELQKTTELSPCEKWFPNNVKMMAYLNKYIAERDDCQRRGEPLSPTAKTWLQSVLHYGYICKMGQSTMDSLYYYSKALFWTGAEFSPFSPQHDIVLKDDEKVKEALDVIRMIYEEYRNQDLTKVYKLHAECSKSLGHLKDSLHYMVCSFNASRRASETVLPSFKYLCLYGLGLSQSSDVLETTKTMALRHVKFAIEDEIRFCHYLLRDPNDKTSEDLDERIVQNILDENISGPLCTKIGFLDYPLCKRLYSIYKFIRKLSSDFPEQLKLLLKYIHEKFVITNGTQTMMVFTMNCLEKDHKNWIRHFNRTYPHLVNPTDFQDDNSSFFKSSSSVPEGNSKAVCKEFEYDFCVIHSRHEQDFVACHLRAELEEGLEKFKGFIFERDAPPDQDVSKLLENALSRSKSIIIIISDFFLSHTLIKLEQTLQRFTDRIIPIKVKAIKEDDRLTCFGDIIDGTTYPVNWSKIRSRLLYGSGNHSSILRSMRHLRLEGEGDNTFPCYKMDAKPRGIALIINNIQFKQEERKEDKEERGENKEQPSTSNPLSFRQGAKFDEKNLKDLWKSLDFTTIIKKNLKKIEMELELKSIADISHENYDCLVVCLLSHGDLGKVYSADSKPVDIAEVMSYFYANKCPSLAGKPKLFFIQACQGKTKQTGLTVETDGSVPDAWEPDGPGNRKTIVHDRADFLIGFSTTPGDTSARHPINGSMYISILCNLMQKYVKERLDLLSILTVVNQQVSERNLKNESGDPVLKQVPQPCHTLTKRVVFY